MSDTTKIEWCDSTFNPWIGCTKVSPGCDHCYAEVSTPSRTRGIRWGAGAQRVRTSDANWRQPLTWNRQHEAFFAAHGRRRRVFCASLADVFDNEVPDDWRREALALMEATPALDWLVLTKRIGNVDRMVPARWLKSWPRHIRLGSTTVTQDEFDRDLEKLLRTGAPNFLSVEPMLSELRLPVGKIWCRHHKRYEQNVCMDVAEPCFRWQAYVTDMIDWIIVGGESGHQARAMFQVWARELRDDCKFCGIPFLFKQWGEWAPQIEGRDEMVRYGKKAAGRLLDGREHNEFPRTEHNEITEAA